MTDRIVLRAVLPSEVPDNQDFYRMTAFGKLSVAVARSPDFWRTSIPPDELVYVEDTGPVFTSVVHQCCEDVQTWKQIADELAAQLVSQVRDVGMSDDVRRAQGVLARYFAAVEKEQVEKRVGSAGHGVGAEVQDDDG
jgi:hypothetical protein